jgi:hypothetical protein
MKTPTEESKGDFVIRRMKEIAPEDFADGQSILTVPLAHKERMARAFKLALEEAERTYGRHFCLPREFIRS